MRHQLSGPPGSGRRSQTVKELKGAGAMTIAADVTDAQQVAAMISQIKERFGPGRGAHFLRRS